MTRNSYHRNAEPVRWRYLLLAAFIFVATALVLAGLWQLGRVYPRLVAMGTPSATPSATARPTATLTPTPAILHPTITELGATADDEARTITFHLEAEVPRDRHIAEVILWYDTETGHQLQRRTGRLPPDLSLSHQLDVSQEGLTTTLTSGELDYWWLVRDTSGEAIRQGETVVLGPALQALVATPTPEPPPIDFTWTVSGTRHYQFHYAPGTAAERDRFRIGALAETALARTVAALEVEFEGQMDIYLIPRVFWQGGAAYGEKVQLLSYLDRNYTDVETWSYFTHEGTHALAQDLLQPKENGGGPDGVLVEGLAVWASGGHYREEPIDAWAAAVAASDQYIPLAELRAGPFYDFQHEISYLEGASFVKFLVEEYGLEELKELYGLATGDAAHDETLVEDLYGKSYAELESDWLAYLDSLEPTAEQVETWELRVRSFDLMRRYQTELDPDARILPDKSPTEWMSDTLQIFLHRVDAPVNVALETALIAVQDRLNGGDSEGAAALLDDVEAALDAGGALERPSLQARQAILDLVARQDRAILRADAPVYLETLAPAYARKAAVEELLQTPFVAYEQEIVRLDVADDGLSAQGVVLIHAQVAEGVFSGDGQLAAVVFAKTAEGWHMTSQEPAERTLSPPPARGD
jgi:hypothetical protein